MYECRQQSGYPSDYTRAGGTVFTGAKGSAISVVDSYYTPGGNVTNGFDIQTPAQFKKKKRRGDVPWTWKGDKADVYTNLWKDLDTTSVTYHISEPVDPTQYQNEYIGNVIGMY